MLLSASPSLANLKTGPLRKIGDTLASMYQQYNSASSDATADTAVQSSNGDVQIEAYANSNGATLAKSLTKLNAINVQTHGLNVSATVPVSELRKIAALTNLRFAEPALFVTSAGLVTSQGDIADQAANVRSALGLTGSGVMVGILSDSFNTKGGTDTYATDVASGDLPAGVQIITDAAGGTDEGRAMAQVIYDSAPGVNFAFETAEGGQAAFAAHIQALATLGCKIIVDDVTYPTEPMFQDGIVAQAVEAVVAEGVSYFSAAGNLGSDSYASNWQTGIVRANGAITSAPGAPHFYGGTTFNFGTPGNVNDLNTFQLGANQSIFLSFQWDSPYFSANGKVGSPNDMDVYVLNSTGNQVLGGSATNNMGADPTEVFAFTNTTGITANFKLMLVWNTASGGPPPGSLKYVDFDGQAIWTISENSGTIFGHANATGAIAVGAASYSQTPAFGVTPPQVESYSSTGPTPILFNTAGTRLTTSVIRQTPAIVAPDNVDNTFFGVDTDNDPYPNFTGTSASAASAAAVGALLLQQNPSLTPAGVAGALENTALDMGTPGVDNLTGYGLIRANTAVASTVGSISGTVFQDNNGNGTLDSGETVVSGITVYFDANNDGTLNTGDISTTTNSQGAYTLNFLPVGADVIREVVPSGFTAITGSKTVILSAGTAVTGINLGIFPTIIANGTGGNSYLLEVDPTTTANIDIFKGSTLLFTAPKSLVPVLNFNLTGGNNTLTANYTNGDPAPGNGVDFLCGAVGSSTGNSLIVIGSNFIDTIVINDFLTFPGQDALNISNVQTVTVTGNNGNDTLTLGQNLTANVSFDGGAGTNTLIYDGAANGSSEPTGPPTTDVTVAETISVSNTQLSDTTSTVTFTNTQIVNVVALVDGDNVQVNMTASAPALIVDATGMGETVNLNTGSSGSSVTVVGTGGGDILNIASGYASPVNYSGGVGDNVLIFNGTGGANTTTITSSTISDSADTVTYATIGFLTVNGLGSANTFTIASSAPAATVTTTINGGTAVNTLNINTPLPNSGATTFFNGGLSAGVQNTININAGALQFTADPQSTSANLTVNDNSSLIFAAAAPGTGINPLNITNLNLGANSAAAIIDAAAHSDRAVLVLNTLSINPTAKFDVAGNDIIVHNGNLTQLTSSLSTGFSNGFWNGTGIASSTAQNNASHSTAMGMLLNNGHGIPYYTMFDNQPVVTTDVLIKYTYYGDANLDGIVNSTDYTVTDNGFNTKQAGWSAGDFNYDGLINGSDYTLLDNAYNSQSTQF